MSTNDPFLDRDRPHGEILFNFRGRHLDDLAPFASGYRDAGARLAAIMADLPSHRDNDGYPILFLYRHALELYLKAILVQAYRLSDLVLVVDEEADDDAPSVPPSSDRGSVWKSHSLFKLYSDVEAVLDLLRKQLPGGPDFLREWRPIVERVAEMDDGSYAFRYPVTTKGGALHPAALRVNVLIFAEKLDEMCHALAGACIHLRENFQATAETKYAVQELLAGRRMN